MTYIGKNFLLEGETLAVETIAAAGGQTVGRSAFLGQALRPDSFYLTIDGTDPNDSALWAAHALPAVPMIATAHGIFLDHAAALEWASRVIGALPQTWEAGAAPLKLLRVESLGPLARETMAFPNFPAEVMAWTLDIAFRLVLQTGGKVEA